MIRTLFIVFAFFMSFIATIISSTAFAKSNDKKDCEHSDLDRSIRGCTKIINSKRESREIKAIAYYNRGIAYKKNGQYDKALADYSKSIQLNPKSAATYFKRGLIYIDKGQYDLAISDYNKAIQLNPKDVFAYFNRGVAYYRRQQYEKAIANFSKVIELRPNYANAYTSRGSAYELKGQKDLAIADFRKALKLSPDSKNTRTSLERMTEKESPVPKTLLQLDTGGHMAVIRDIIFTPDGKQLISASEDKVIRIWDLDTGKTVRTIRGESAPGLPGTIYAMALSPDGKWLAVGGWLSGTREEKTAIRLYDFNSGRLVALMKGHLDTVAGLAFSPDGKLLISGSSGGAAIIWDIKYKRLKQRLLGHRSRIYAVGFTSDGKRAVTGSYDHDLRLWRVIDGQMVAVMRGHRSEVQSLTVAPNGNIASADTSGEIRLWDGKTGLLHKVVPNRYDKHSILSPNGKYLLSCLINACHVYDMATSQILTRYHHQSGLVSASTISSNGRWVAIGGRNDNGIHIWDLHTGKQRLDADGRPLVLRGVGQSVETVGFTKDGRRFGWGNIFRLRGRTMHGLIQQVLTLPTIQTSLTRPEKLERHSTKTFLRAVINKQGWSLADRKGERIGFDSILDIKQDGRLIASIKRGPSNGYDHRTYGFTPDGKTVISGGSNGFLTAYSLQGKKLGDFVGQEGAVSNIAVSPDGRYLVSGSNDQTVRLWNVKTRKLLVTLFYGQDGEWVMWTPEGFFMGSENGVKLVGWQINQGARKAASYVNAAQIRKIFYRPDLVAAKIAGDPDGLVREAARKFDLIKILRSGPAPKVEIVSPGNNQRVGDFKAVVTVRLTNTGGGVGRVLWKVNGQLRGTTDGRAGVISRELYLGREKNVIEVVAFNKAGFIESNPVTVTVRLQPSLLTEKPDLYVLAVGADEYNKPNRLEFAVRDATQLTKTIRAAASSERGKGLYRNIIVETLTNGQVTKANMAATFRRLGRKMRPTDVFVFFIAGHGKTKDGDYYFIPPSFKAEGKNPIIKQGFGPKDWELWMSNIRAERSLMIFDTCEAGSISKLINNGAQQQTAYDRLKDLSGRMMLMATTQQDVALEGYNNKHGVLTYAILEAFALSDGNKDLKIMPTELVRYVSGRVPQMSCELTQEDGKECYRQEPQARFKGISFPIIPLYEKAYPGGTKEKKRIPQLKKQFTSFQHGTKFQDCAECPRMIVVKGGTFLMGAPKDEKDATDLEKPQRKVTIKKFAVGRFEITNAEYVAFLNDVKRRGSKNEPWFKTKAEVNLSEITGSVGNFKVEPGKENYPVTNVSWYGAKAYAAWLSRKTGKKYRILTESEWEYVARAGTTTRYSWGEKFLVNKVNNTSGTPKRSPNDILSDRNQGGTKKVGSYEANGFGVFDMHGNVREWVEDCLGNYSNAPNDGSAMLNENHAFCNYRVYRGGSWASDSSFLRVSHREGNFKKDRSNLTGFRVASTL